MGISDHFDSWVNAQHNTPEECLESLKSAASLEGTRPDAASYLMQKVTVSQPLEQLGKIRANIEKVQEISKGAFQKPYIEVLRAQEEKRVLLYAHNSFLNNPNELYRKIGVAAEKALRLGSKEAVEHFNETLVNTWQEMVPGKLGKMLLRDTPLLKKYYYSVVQRRWNDYIRSEVQGLTGLLYPIAKAFKQYEATPSKEALDKLNKEIREKFTWLIEKSLDDKPEASLAQEWPHLYSYYQEIKNTPTKS